MSIVKHFKSCLIYIVITIASSIPSAMADNPSVVVNIDANAGKRSINPEIYGVNSADEAAVSALNVPLNRLGGNRTSRYNWLENADGTASDYYFESYPGDSAVEGEIGDTFYPLFSFTALINSIRGTSASPRMMASIWGKEVRISR